MLWCIRQNPGTINIGFPNPKSVGRVRRHLVLLQNTSTTTHNSFIVPVYRNELVSVEQSFTVFLHGKAASRPFKLTSAMEFFLRDNTFNFSKGGQVPPCPWLWAPMVYQSPPRLVRFVFWYHCDTSNLLLGYFSNLL